MRVLVGLASLALILTVLPGQAQSLRERLRQELEEAREEVRDEVAEAIDEEDAAQAPETAVTPAAASTAERAPDSADAAAARAATRRATPAADPAVQGRARGAGETTPTARTLEPSSPEVVAAVRAASDKSEQCAAVPADAEPQLRQAATSCTQLCGMLIDQIPRIAAANADAIPQMQFLCDGAHAQSLGLPMPQPPGRANPAQSTR